MTLLTRLTLTISDTSQNHRLSDLSKSYSLLALRPTNEKSFQLCCGSLDCDIISVDFSQRLPFILKFKTVSSALQRGIRFEICYSPAVVGDSNARRNVISGATSLIRATRGKSIILSSEAKTALGLRAPYDVMNLAQIWGLGQERGKEAVCEEADRVVRLARLRRESYRGAISIIDSGRPTEEEQPIAGKAKNTNEANVTKIDNSKTGTNNTKSIKRKASTTLLEANGSAPPEQEDKPLSKRQQKKQAKKARLESHAQPNDSSKTADTNNSFPIKHEASSLSAGVSKVSKKS